MLVLFLLGWTLEGREKGKGLRMFLQDFMSLPLPYGQVGPKTSLPITSKPPKILKNKDPKAWDTEEDPNQADSGGELTLRIKKGHFVRARLLWGFRLKSVFCGVAKTPTETSSSSGLQNQRAEFRAKTAAGK